MWSHNSSECNQWRALLSTTQLSITQHLKDWWLSPVEHSFAKPDHRTANPASVRYNTQIWSKKAIDVNTASRAQWTCGEIDEGVNTTPLWGHRQVRGHLGWPNKNCCRFPRPVNFGVFTSSSTGSWFHPFERDNLGTWFITFVGHTMHLKIDSKFECELERTY